MWFCVSVSQNRIAYLFQLVSCVYALVIGMQVNVCECECMHAWVHVNACMNVNACMGASMCVYMMISEFI